ncbi:hypothetical protein VTK73DRAFT_6582 [Phialemonium thermophilum]|uniref:F-box domain-containing protein n=1 Tax=Phialemonium thermophilum TaxID=223376 RepID=A0ABR3WJ05_9PEZI
MAVPKDPGLSHIHLRRDCPPDHKTLVQLRPSTPDRTARSSFSSIRETDSDLAQTFTSSKISSSSVIPEDAVDTSTPGTPMLEARFQPPLTRPDSRLHGYWCPPDSFQGWKQINVRGKLASKSFGDLQVLKYAWNPPRQPPPPRRKGACAPGASPFERLPIEILSSIINLLVLDVPPNGLSRRNVDLMSLLLTSKTLHTATLNSLYSKITIPHSRIFQKFLAHISAHPALGTIVRRLDFCHFNPSQLFSTAAERYQARNLTSETLLQCLELTPNLQEFLAQEYIDEDLDAKVLAKLFWGLPRLQAVDFCGCTSAAFKESFVSLLGLPWPDQLSITRLSLHKCLTLPSSIFEVLLPRMPHLTHLDVAGTRITDKALASIPATARITHLNLAKCTLLSARAVIDFLAHHPAVTGSLVFLSIASDARSHQLLGPDDVSELLPVLPQTIKSLSLKGSRMVSSHINLLRPLTKHLEELALGRDLRIDDVNLLFVPDPTQGVEAQLSWVPHTLKYLDLSDFWGSELDLSYLFSNRCAILTKFSEPLDVLEISDDIARRLNKSPGSIARSGWRISDCGHRTWLVRLRAEGDRRRDDGARSWKMGAESWGMRKIPVARAEVGGMYGSFMFGRKL